MQYATIGTFALVPTRDTDRWLSKRTIVRLPTIYHAEFLVFLGKDWLFWAFLISSRIQRAKQMPNCKKIWWPRLAAAQNPRPRLSGKYFLRLTVRPKISAWISRETRRRLFVLVESRGAVHFYFTLLNPKKEYWMGIDAFSSGIDIFCAFERCFVCTRSKQLGFGKTETAMSDWLFLVLWRLRHRKSPLLRQLHAPKQSRLEPWGEAHIPFVRYFALPMDHRGIFEACANH